MIAEPTRIDSNNILDLLLTNNPSLIHDISVRESLDTSDHSIIRFSIHSDKKVKDNKILVYDYPKGNYTKFKAILAGINWESLLYNKSAHDMWDIFKAEINKIQKICISLKQT